MVDDAVREYIDAIDPEHRPLFDRVRGLIVAAVPDATQSISYGILAFTTGPRRRLYLGAWKHGVSLYGWQQGDDGGFSARHPELVTGKGTIKLREPAAETLADAEIIDLARAVLEHA
jgi:uncharacterized protein YdhG (YjbR/CyaY superfamily)